MPSYRDRTPSPTAIHVIPGTPPKTPPKAVAFPSGLSPVTSISRPLTNPERWTLYHFERHCRLCETCCDPYHLHKAHGSLCSEGYQLAQHVAAIVYSKHGAKDVYDATTGRDREPIKVELPHDYLEVRSLLKAMERSLRHRSQRPIVSFDRAYYYGSDRVQSEAPSRHLSYRQPTAYVVRDLSARALVSSSSRSMQNSPTRRQERPRSTLLPSTVLDYHTADVRPRPTSKVFVPTRVEDDEAPMTPESRSPSSSKSSSSPPRTSATTRPFRRENSVVPPMMSGALQPTMTPPTTPPRQASVAPAPDAPKPRRTVMLPQEDNRRSSWYAGAPYQTQLREPKKMLPSEKEKEKRPRRYSMFMF